MKKIMLLSILLPVFFCVQSQVIVTLQIPQTGLSIKPQLWNAILINTGNTSLSVKIDLTLTDIATGQQVFSASSAFFNLQQGSTNITANNVLPVSYTILNPGYNVDQSPNGFLPIGNFNICYQIIKQREDTYNDIADECETIEIQPLSPPFLNTPDDQVEIEDVRPLFTWIPPTPLSLFSNLTYKYILVEVLRGQSSSEAIQQNIPILQQNNISQTNLQYPITAAALDTGKNYAWQITANSNSLPISNSEIWSFKISSPQTDNKIISKSISYIKLMPINSIPFTICSDYLRFEYLNESNDSLVAIKITDISSKNLKIISENDQQEKVHFGENFKEIDIRELNLKAGHFYLFQLENNRQEKLFVKFQYKNN